MRGHAHTLAIIPSKVILGDQITPSTSGIGDDASGILLAFGRRF
jgi:hypothetical protein